MGLSLVSPIALAFDIALDESNYRRMSFAAGTWTAASANNKSRKILRPRADVAEPSDSRRERFDAQESGRRPSPRIVLR
jgi:hypothetical protein